MTTYAMHTRRPAVAGLCSTTPVLTPAGWKALAELSAGDLVVDREGIARRVVHREPAEPAPVLRVSVADGTVLHAAPGQPWLVEVGTGSQRQVETVTTLELADLVGRRSGVRLVRTGAAVLGGPASDLSLPPYVLGCLLANGAISSGCSVRLWTTEQTIRAHVERDLPAGARFGPTPSVVGTAVGWSIIGTQRGPGGNPVLNALRELGLTGCRSFEKFVPEPYKYAGAEQRHALLQGLLDCDGAADPAGQVTFSSASAQLAEDVAFLVRSLGGRCSLGRRTGITYTSPTQRQPKAARDSFKVGGIRLFDYPPFRLPRKAERVRDSARTRLWSVREVQWSGVAEVTSLVVDPPTGLFLADGWVPVASAPLALPQQAPLLAVAA